MEYSFVGAKIKYKLHFTNVKRIPRLFLPFIKHPSLYKNLEHYL